MGVIVLIGLLAGAVAIAVRSYLIAGKQGVARLEVSKICQAIETFYTHYDRFPTNDEGIEILAQPSQKFADGLLTKTPKDPWGNPYEYVVPGANKPYEVVCYGADGREGGDGADLDISSDDLSEDSQP
jgi:general secretion pathway protein G